MSNTETKVTESEKTELMNMVNGEEASKETETKTQVTEKTDTEASASENTDSDKSAQTEENGTDWKAEARKWESRSKENKEKADAHDALVTKVSDLEQQLSEYKTKAATADLEVTRWKVAAKYSVAEEDVNLFLTASDEETLIKQAERLSKTSAHAPKPDAAQGTRTSTGNASTEQQGAAALSGLFQ